MKTPAEEAGVQEAQRANASNGTGRRAARLRSGLEEIVIARAVQFHEAAGLLLTRRDETLEGPATGILETLNDHRSLLLLVN